MRFFYTLLEHFPEKMNEWHLGYYSQYQNEHHDEHDSSKEYEMWLNIFPLDFRWSDFKLN